MAPDIETTEHAATAGRQPAKCTGAHETDAGSDRPYVPDGQDARGHADAQQRPLADELQVYRRRAWGLAPRPDSQRQGAGDRGDVPEDQPISRTTIHLPRSAVEGNRRKWILSAR